MTEHEHNTSGLGAKAIIPDEIKKGWNWGAFALNWIWGIGNNSFITFLLWIPFLCLLVLAVSIVVFNSVIEAFYFMPLLALVLMLYFGWRGNQWAWRNKRWESLAHFERTQRRWKIAGFFTLALSLAFFAWAGLFFANTLHLWDQSPKTAKTKLHNLEAPEPMSVEPIKKTDEQKLAEAARQKEQEAKKHEPDDGLDLVLIALSKNADLMQELGEPMHYTGLTKEIHGTVTQYSFTLAGANAKGTVHAKATQKGEEWMFNEANITMSDGRVIKVGH